MAVGDGGGDSVRRIIIETTECDSASDLSLWCLNVSVSGMQRRGSCVSCVSCVSDSRVSP